MPKHKGTCSIPRFGTDLGGVLNKHCNDIPNVSPHWYRHEDSEVPNAMMALQRIVLFFGAENVFIISKCRGAMRRNSEFWLHDVMDVCGRTGLRKENIHFCDEVGGPDGKGPLAATLGISHFVDDSDEALASLWEDGAGNTRAAIEQHNGKLFWFARSGIGYEAPMTHEDHPNCVEGVANWMRILTRLGLDDDP